MLAVVLDSGWILNVADIAENTADGGRPRPQRERSPQRADERRPPPRAGGPGLQRAGARQQRSPHAAALGERSGAIPRGDAARRRDAERHRPVRAVSRGGPAASGAVPAGRRTGVAARRTGATHPRPRVVRAPLPRGRLRRRAHRGPGRADGRPQGNPRLLQRARNRHRHVGARRGRSSTATATSAPPDLERAGAAVSVSLGQVLEALDPDSPIRRAAAELTLPPGLSDGTFSVCRASTMPGWTAPPEVATDLLLVLRSTPMPFRGPGYPSLPRFRAEIGPFVGIVSGVQGEGADGGFAANREGGLVGSMDVGLRLGVGLDALLGDSSDGLVFVQGGIVLQSRSSGGCGTMLSDRSAVVPVRAGPARTLGAELPPPRRPSG